MQNELHVILTQTFDKKPLATVCNMPGQDADMTPAEMRALAAALYSAAAECEARPMDDRHFMRVRRSYPVSSSPDLPAAVYASPLPLVFAGLGLYRLSEPSHQEGQRPSLPKTLKPYLRRYSEDEIRKLKAELGISPNPASPAPTACAPAPQTLRVAPVSDLTGHE